MQWWPTAVQRRWRVVHLPIAGRDQPAVAACACAIMDAAWRAGALAVRGECGGVSESRDARA